MTTSTRQEYTSEETKQGDIYFMNWAKSFMVKEISSVAAAINKSNFQISWAHAPSTSHLSAFEKIPMLQSMIQQQQYDLIYIRQDKQDSK